VNASESSPPDSRVNSYCSLSSPTIRSKELPYSREFELVLPSPALPSDLLG